MWQPKDTAPFAFIQCYGIGGGTDIDRKDTSPQRGELGNMITPSINRHFTITYL